MNFIKHYTKLALFAAVVLMAATSCNENQVAEAPVCNGATTVVGSHLQSGVYIVKVGNKALKFIKK